MVALALALTTGSGVAGARPDSGDGARTGEARAALAELRAITGRGATFSGRRDGHGHVTPLLRQLLLTRTALRGEERQEADAWFQRPSDGAGPDEEFGYTVPEATPVDTAHFRIHYVTSGSQAATLAYVNEVGQVFEEVYAEEVTRQRWRAPSSDGTLGGDGRTDVYVTELGQASVYGYASGDDDNVCTDPQCSNVHGFMVMDNDYDGYLPDPDGALRATTAHEYHHLVQFGIGANIDFWMFESTATWEESVNYPRIDARTFYIESFASQPELPFTDVSEPSGFDRAYGLYVWNLWVAAARGPEVIRAAWDAAAAAGGLSLTGYDQALVADGSSFATEFTSFATATAAWEDLATGFPPEPSGFDYAGTPVMRAGSLSLGQQTEQVLDHAAYALFDISAPDGTEVTVVGPSDAAAGAGLVVAGRAPEVQLLQGGSATFTVSGANNRRVTLAVVNADVAVSDPGNPATGEPATYAADDSAFAIGVGVVPPPPDGGGGEPAPEMLGDGDRLDGGGLADPIGQAILTSQLLFDDGTANRVVLATADRYPDALAGAPLTSGAGPILYTSGLGALDARTRAEIERVTGGNGEVLVLGGTQAVSDQAAAQAGAAGGDVPCTAPVPTSCRYAGAARDETAALAAQTIYDENPLNEMAFLARSNEFADAITGGALATALGAPILLTFPDSPSPFAAEFIASNDVPQIAVLGGEVAVNESTAMQLTGTDPDNGQIRIAGPERTATSVEIARAWTDAGLATEGAFLVNVRDANAWQTALSAAVASALYGAPQIGVETPPTAVGDQALAYLAEFGGPVAAFGDTALVSDQQLEQAVAAG